MIRVSSFLFGTIRTHHVEVCCGIQRNQQDKEKLACRSRKCVYSIWRASFTKIGFPQNTISQHYYRQVIERLRRRRFLGVRPNTADNWGLHRDNAHPMLWGKFFFLPTLIFVLCVWVSVQALFERCRNLQPVLAVRLSLISKREIDSGRTPFRNNRIYQLESLNTGVSKRHFKGWVPKMVSATGLLELVYTQLEKASSNMTAL